MRKELGTAVLEKANKQLGILTYHHLIALGVSPSAITRAIQAGRLVRLHRGVYVVGHSALRPEARWLAAYWGSGERSALSHVSAVACLGYGVEPSGPVHISTTARTASRDGIVIHRVKTLDRLDVCDIEVRESIAIKVTTIPRTVVDQADELGWDEFRALADRIPRLHLGRMIEAQERAPGRRGAAKVQRFVEADQAHTRSKFERRYLRFCDTFSLARPDNKNVPLAGHVADCIYYGPRVVVELDGRAYHQRRDQMRVDRQRDADYQLAGYAILRLVWDDLHRDEAAKTAEKVRQFLTRAA